MPTMGCWSTGARAGSDREYDGAVPATSGVPLYDEEPTLRGLEPDDRPVRKPILERLAEPVDRGDLTPVVAETYEFEEPDRAQRDVVAGGDVGKPVVTP